MAKQSSFIKIEGTLDDLTFYKTGDGYQIRKRAGVSGSRIANDPAFARTRENGQEFGHSAAMGKILRKAVVDLSSQISDRRIVSRVVRLMTSLKNLDTTSMRGERQVAVGLALPEGKQLLKGFDFNSESPLQAVLKKDVKLDPATGTITIVDFDPKKQLDFPQGATHVSFKAGFANVNFSTGQTDLQLSPDVISSVHAPPTTLEIIPDEVPAGDGVALYLLLVEFYQEMNGATYPLNNGAFNALNIVEVI